MEIQNIVLIPVATIPYPTADPWTSKQPGAPKNQFSQKIQSRGYAEETSKNDDMRCERVTFAFSGEARSLVCSNFNCPKYASTMMTLRTNYRKIPIAHQGA